MFASFFLTDHITNQVIISWNDNVRKLRIKRDSFWAKALDWEIPTLARTVLS
jgi:hypothetical protein